MIEIADQYAQVEGAFDRVQDDRSARKSKAFWNDGTWHVVADQLMDVLVRCYALGGAAKRVEEASSRHEKSIFLCRDIFVVDIAGDLGEQLIVGLYRGRSHVVE